MELGKAHVRGSPQNGRFRDVRWLCTLKLAKRRRREAHRKMVLALAAAAMTPINAAISQALEMQAVVEESQRRQEAMTA